MYIEILQQCVIKHIDRESNKPNKTPLVVVLTPFIYKTLQLELNDYCKFNTEVPIQEATFTSVMIYDRTVTIERGDKLNADFEIGIVQTMISAKPLPAPNNR